MSSACIPKPIAITGATGWVGRTSLYRLSRLFPVEWIRNNVYLFASKQSLIQIPSSNGIASARFEVYPLHLLPNLVEANCVKCILHTAFLTRDRLPLVGLNNYIDINQSITELLLASMKASPNTRLVSISSGAAAKYKDLSRSEAAVFDDPYGVLKRMEEQSVLLYPQTLVLRIYALTGRFIRDAHRFAIGDFLLAAKLNNEIRISSKSPVLRSYGFASDIVDYAINLLLSDIDMSDKDILNAATHNLDLESLAQRVTALFSLPPVDHSIDKASFPDTYQCDTSPFIAALHSLNIKPSSMDSQILDTYLGI